MGCRARVTRVEVVEDIYNLRNHRPFAIPHLKLLNSAFVAAMRFFKSTIYLSDIKR